MGVPCAAILSATNEAVSAALRGTERVLIRLHGERAKGWWLDASGVNRVRWDVVPRVDEIFASRLSFVESTWWCYVTRSAARDGALGSTDNAIKGKPRGGKTTSPRGRTTSSAR